MSTEPAPAAETVPTSRARFRPGPRGGVRVARVLVGLLGAVTLVALLAPLDRKSVV